MGNGVHGNCRHAGHYGVHRSGDGSVPRAIDNNFPSVLWPHAHLAHIWCACVSVYLFVFVLKCEGAPCSDSADVFSCFFFGARNSEDSRTCII